MITTGEQIGRYLIRSAIGKGGMGEVFLAEDTELKRPVALLLHQRYTRHICRRVKWLH